MQWVVAVVAAACWSIGDQAINELLSAVASLLPDDQQHVTHLLMGPAEMGFLVTLLLCRSRSCCASWQTGQ